MDKKVLVVGLDGATWKVLKPLMKKGEMPFLADLVRKSSWGTSESVIPPITAPNWASFQTGVNPGKHGVFGFLDYYSDLENPGVVNSKNIRRKRIWEFLQEKGLKSLIINLPVTYPVGKMNGAMISSFLTPEGKKYTYPKNLISKLKKVGYKIDVDLGGSYGEIPENIDKYSKNIVLEKILDVANKRKNALFEVFDIKKYNFIFIMFKGTDIVQHIYWGTKELDEFYSKFDAILKDLYIRYKRVSKDGYFLLVSDHGFHKYPTSEFAPYAWLRKEGFIHEGANLSNIWKFARYINALFKKYLFNLSDVKVFYRTKKLLVKEGRKSQTSRLSITVAFEGIYLTNMNRSKRKQILKMVPSMLRQMKHNGNKVFDKVDLKKDVYYGENLYRGPDIVWMTNKHYSLNLSPFAEEMFTERKKSLRGQHESDMEGIFIANGKNIPKNNITDVQITDLMPIIMHSLNLDIPGDIDGKLPMGMFTAKERSEIALKSRYFSNEIDKEITTIKNE